MPIERPHVAALHTRLEKPAGGDPRQASNLNRIVAGHDKIEDEHDEERLANGTRRDDRQIRHYPQQDRHDGDNSECASRRENDRCETDNNTEENCDRGPCDDRRDIADDAKRRLRGKFRLSHRGQRDF